MKTEVVVHGAAGTIGSSCAEIVHGRDHLVIDYGSPMPDLEEKESKADRSPVPFVFPKTGRHNYRVLVSHSHLDHFGNMDSIPAVCGMHDKRIDVIASERTITAIEMQLKDRKCRELSPMEPGTDYRWRSFTYMAIHCDHSASDACGFIIGTGRRTILYTGDFRLHGREGKRYIDDIRSALKLPCFRNLPLTVITEATNIGKPFGPTEQEVEDLMVEEFSKPGPVMVKMSNQNTHKGSFFVSG